MTTGPAETRRTVLKLGAAAAVGSAALSGTGTAKKNGWRAVDLGISTTLYDATMTSEGPYAVGAGGLVLARRADGWQPVLQRGPTVESNPLRGCDVTDDGRNIWFCGGSGVVAQYDVVDEQLTDYSAPMGKTSTWLNVSAVGDAGSETVYLINGSGEFLRGTKTSEGGMDWGEVVKPGGGSSAYGIDFWTETSGYVVDTSGSVYRTEDGGDSWTTVGIDGTSANLWSVAARNEGDLDVGSSSGRIFRLNDGDGKGWKRKDVGESSVRALDRKGKIAGLAAGANGYVYNRKNRDWDQVATPAEATLLGVALDLDNGFPDVAVGEGGTILERGEWEAPPQNTITLSSADGSEVGYELRIDGATEKLDAADGGDSVTTRTGRFSTDTVSGRVGGGDASDVFGYSGEVVDLTVTSGDPGVLVVDINGTTVSLSDLRKEPWTVAETPTTKGLRAAVQTTEGPYAVGAGGDVVARRKDEWELVLDAGPVTASNPLTDAGVTADGRNVWFCGGSGVVAQYDVVDEQLTDYSAPKGKTSTWEAVAVTGDAGSETVHLVNGSGEHFRGTKTSEGGMDWGTAVKPGGGSSMKGIDFLDASTGYICDTNAKVYETTDGGDSWASIGIDGGSVGLYGVSAAAPDDIVVAAGGGTVFRYNGAVWTKLWAGENKLYSVDYAGEESWGLAVGSGGSLYGHSADGWEPRETPVTTSLYGVARDTTGSYPDVAVGGGGTVVERGPYTAPERDTDPQPADWSEVASPTGKALNAATGSADGPFAVGGSGRVLARRSTGWEVVVKYGPTGQGNTLKAAGSSDDGQNVWFAGGSGAIGKYDVADERLTDYSAPNGKTSTWEAMGVAGSAGSETVYLVNGSGEVLVGTNDGGTMTWGTAVKPGGGSSAKGLDLIDASTGYVVDTNAKVYQTTDGGDTWSTIGVEGGTVGFYGVSAVSTDLISVAGGDGSLQRYNGAVWTKRAVADAALYGIDRTETAGAAVGSSGMAYGLTEEGWKEATTPTGNTLNDVVLGDGGPDVAVGSSGTILERSG
jgi:photosystem II stability/assembly factor-like uncharacterized protein